MKRVIFLVGAGAALAGCGQSAGGSSNQASLNGQQPKKPPAFCFFKGEEMKDWSASRDKDGNISLKGKAHVKDSRYKAVLGPPSITGSSAQIAPTITLNTGYEAPDDWWDLSAGIANSAGITKITVTCGAQTVAQLSVPPKS